MEKRKVIPLPATPAPAAVDDSPARIAEALAAQGETTLVTLEVARILKDQIIAGLGDHAAALKDIVARITDSREVDVEVTGRDENGRIQSLKVRSHIAPSTLH